jgi:hypothetical protein
MNSSEMWELTWHRRTHALGSEINSTSPVYSCEVCSPVAACWRSCGGSVVKISSIGASSTAARPSYMCLHVTGIRSAAPAAKAAALMGSPQQARFIVRLGDEEVEGDGDDMLSGGRRCVFDSDDELKTCRQPAACTVAGVTATRTDSFQPS